MMSLKYLFFGILISGFALVGFMVNEPEDTQFSEKVKVALRSVGNDLLLSQNDSTSLVLPIIEVEAHVYNLAFENTLSIHPDNLFKIVSSSLKASNLKEDYRIVVTQCDDNEVAYSYEIYNDEEKSILPCLGRSLPEACYTIQVRFLKNGSDFRSKQVPFYGLIVIGFVAIGLWRNKKKDSETSDSKFPFMKLGRYHFYKDQNKLVLDGNTIQLSTKECELLHILSNNINNVVKREILIKEVWEDKGVIVGRSLDTFISKLRKKLLEEDNVNIVNVHGVGYKLEVIY